MLRFVGKTVVKEIWDDEITCFNFFIFVCKMYGKTENVPKHIRNQEKTYQTVLFKRGRHGDPHHTPQNLTCFSTKFSTKFSTDYSTKSSS